VETTNGFCQIDNFGFDSFHLKVVELKNWTKE
jgi:hypothetical protein